MLVSIMVSTAIDIEAVLQKTREELREPKEVGVLARFVSDLNLEPMRRWETKSEPWQRSQGT